MVRLFPPLRRVFGLRCERGNVAVLFAVTLPLIVGGAGVGVETTFWRYKQLQMQGAADAAAFAGASEKRAGSNDAAVTTAATTAAGQNGFDTVAGTVAVETPALVNGASQANAVKVELSAVAPRFFTAYFTGGAVQLKARATATFSSGGAACILALDPSAPQALLVSGSAQVTLNGCSVMADSVSDTAVVTQGSSRLTTTCIASAGGAALSGTVNLTGCSSAATQVSPAPDPYRTLAAPTASGACKTVSGTALTPGAYCSGMQINGDATLAPGVYVVSGGDFRLNGGANISGSGVTIYLTGGARVRMNGNAVVDLSAPTSGTYAGILFFGDRTSIGGSNDFNGTAGSHLTGAIYFPSQDVDYAGNFSGQNGCTQVVARKVAWSGNTSVSVDCSSLGMSSVPVLSTVKLVG